MPSWIRGLVFAGLLHMVNDEDFYWTFGRFQFQSELLLDRCEDRRPCRTVICPRLFDGIRRPIERALERSSQAGRVQRRTLKPVVESTGRSSRRDRNSANLAMEVSALTCQCVRFDWLEMPEADSTGLS